MGVKDLWKLLDAAGRPVSLESLQGLILAIGELYDLRDTVFPAAHW
jgi:hypothetical protein